ncbi:homoserine dehydrogenase [Thermoflavimicrobium daqui]|nr:homoserine dehydrogenase [Thermoflavimicrobium daqui]
MGNQRTSKQLGIMRIGLLGLGTVGSGVIQVLEKQQELIKERTGYQIEVPLILVRDLKKKREVTVRIDQLTTEGDRVVENPDISVVIEVIGGIEPARTLLLKAIRSGKHVITANKELLAKHGAELLQEAKKAGVQLLFEASVAGGIPVIHFLQKYLTVNQVQEISGILNGTTNYILTKMEETGQSYQEALAEAQALGYAEADPTSDVEGYDAAYKLAILTNLAFDVNVDPIQIFREGITRICQVDLMWAKQLGYATRLLGRTRNTNDELYLSVEPCLLPLTHPLAQVKDVFNAVMIDSDVVGEVTLVGKGAGSYPTASAVMEDLTALMRQSEEMIRSTDWQESIKLDSGNQMNDSTFFVRLNVPNNIKEELIEKLKEMIHHDLYGVMSEPLVEKVGPYTFIGFIIQRVHRFRLWKALNHLSMRFDLGIDLPLMLPVLELSEEAEVQLSSVS